MMDDILKSALGRTPELGVLVVLSWMYLRAFKDLRESATIERREFVDRLTQFHQDHMQARAESRNAIDKIALAMEKMASALATCPLKKNPME